MIKGSLDRLQNRMEVASPREDGVPYAPDLLVDGLVFWNCAIMMF